MSDDIDIGLTVAHTPITPDDWLLLVGLGKYAPDQAREPAGSPEGGQWIGGGLASQSLPVGRKWIKGGVYTKGPHQGEALPKDTMALYQKAGGEIDPDRQRDVHDPIIKAMLGTAPMHQAQPHAIITVGGYASGKSTMLQAAGIPNDYVHVDPDEIKKSIPEYEQGLHQPDGASDENSATMVHEESSYLAKEVRLRAIMNGQNLIVDGSGKNLTAYLKLFEVLHSHGYTISVLMPDLDMKTGLERAAIRSERDGRRILSNESPDMTESYRAAPPNFWKLCAAADNAQVWDNHGAKPRLVFYRKNRVNQDVDNTYMDEFRKRAHAE